MVRNLGKNPEKIFEFCLFAPKETRATRAKIAIASVNACYDQLASVAVNTHVRANACLDVSRINLQTHIPCECMHIYLNPQVDVAAPRVLRGHRRHVGDRAFVDVANALDIAIGLLARVW